MLAANSIFLETLFIPNKEYLGPDSNFQISDSNFLLLSPCLLQMGETKSHLSIKSSRCSYPSLSLRLKLLLPPTVAWCLSEKMAFEQGPKGSEGVKLRQVRRASAKVLGQVSTYMLEEQQG
jgi:hypothetical protein